MKHFFFIWIEIEYDINENISLKIFVPLKKNMNHKNFIKKKRIVTNISKDMLVYYFM